jgi:chromosomal replication initiation ATPase DnaA
MLEAAHDGKARVRRAQMVAARLCGVGSADLEVGSTAAGARFARQLTMYLANRVYRFSHAESAAIFGRNRHAVSHACRRIDALRDDPKFDWQMFEVETLLRAADLVARQRDPREGAQ